MFALMCGSGEGSNTFLEKINPWKHTNWSFINVCGAERKLVFEDSMVNFVNIIWLIDWLLNIGGLNYKKTEKHKSYLNIFKDAHNSIISFDEGKSLFAVYDGHGGHEVAEYCSLYLPNYIKQELNQKNVGKCFLSLKS